MCMVLSALLGLLACPDLEDQVYNEIAVSGGQGPGQYSTVGVELYGDAREVVGKTGHDCDQTRSDADTLSGVGEARCRGFGLEWLRSFDRSVHLRFGLQSVLSVSERHMNRKYLVRGLLGEHLVADSVSTILSPARLHHWKLECVSRPLKYDIVIREGRGTRPREMSRQVRLPAPESLYVNGWIKMGYVGVCKLCRSSPVLDSCGASNTRLANLLPVVFVRAPEYRFAGLVTVRWPTVHDWGR